MAAPAFWSAALPRRFRMVGVLDWHLDSVPPKKRALVLKPGSVNAGNGLKGDDLIDETLDFGAMRMLMGRAFVMNNGQAQPENPHARDPLKIAKRWTTLEGRDFLIEEVEYQSVKSKLNRLPGGT